jgi:headcase protein
VLTYFSSLSIREIQCIICLEELKIYDKFPLIDGTLFKSPIPQGDHHIIVDNETSIKNTFIYGVCLKCMFPNMNNEGRYVRCKWCKTMWTGGNILQIGTLYKYDIFAATLPCCQKWMNCSHCDKEVLNARELRNNENIPFFSFYSEKIRCKYCKIEDYHLIKPLKMYLETFCLEPIMS